MVSKKGGYGKITQPDLAKEIAATLEGNAEQQTISKLSGLESEPESTDVVYEHMKHHYNKEDKIVRQSCMKAAASCYVPAVDEIPEDIANKVIRISEILFTWVNSK